MDALDCGLVSVIPIRSEIRCATIFHLCCAAPLFTCCSNRARRLPQDPFSCCVGSSGSPAKTRAPAYTGTFKLLFESIFPIWSHQRHLLSWNNLPSFKAANQDTATCYFRDWFSNYLFMSEKEERSWKELTCKSTTWT